LVLLGGHQGFLEVFKVLPGARFERIQQIPTPRAQPMALPWNGGLLLAESTYADGSPRGSVLRAWPGTQPSLPADASTVATLTAADIDGDGRLEVFLGGRVVPGAWARDPGSRLLTVTADRFETRQAWTNLGMVRSAVFADFDADADVDLAVASEWSEPRFLRNEGGVLAPWNPGFVFEGRPLADGALSGLWSSVQPGDFDGDGRLDLVLGNAGANSSWEAFPRPWIACHGDFDSDGTEDVLTGWMDPRFASSAPQSLAGFRPMQGLGVLGAAVPAFRERFRTHSAFAQASFEGILGVQGTRVRRLTVHWVTSVVLLQRSGPWEVRLLPEPAQAAPVLGIGVADFDGDGSEDLFLAQNDFGPNHGLPRDDAGLGLLLRGRGDGTFDALSAEDSGIRIQGEGRSVAVADLDHDGCPDLVVTQRGHETRVLRNRGTRPGLRVRLDAGPANPLAIGASVRWSVDGKSGPARAWTSGAGHGAVDSAFRVLARPATGPGTLQVTWPDGGRSAIPVAAGSTGIRVGRDGRVTELAP